MKTNTTTLFSTHKGLKSTMKINASLLSLVAATAFGVMAAGAAHADINPIAPGTPTITGTGPYTYTYGTVLSDTETLVSGNFFTFFDVNGLISGTETGPAGWTASENLTGPNAVGNFNSAPASIDSASILNVTYTYNGPTVVGAPSGLGNFSFQSIYPVASTRESFTAVADLSGTDILNANGTSYVGPTVSATAVPEPATIVPFALGGLGLLALIVRKNRRASGVTA